MDLINQVCSLELSKRLKELGVKQESLFYWCWDVETPYLIKDKPTHNEAMYCSAFTVAELGEMLPSQVGKYDDNEVGILYLECSKDEEGLWYVRYQNIYEESKLIFKAPTEANTRAKMLIYLIENKLVEI